MADVDRQRAARDFGGLVTRIPREVHAPASVEELGALVRSLRARGLAWVVRGAGHSSGGQPLLRDGAVIDTRLLAGIVDDHGDTVTVLGGTPWSTVLEHLARNGRRPPVVTDQPRVTVGGTLSVGGIGESSHLAGLQIDHVTQLALVTPDGELHHVGPTDELFQFALGGHGQLGVIATATLRTTHRPSALAARNVAFASLDEALAAIAELPYAYVRPRLHWAADATHVTAVVGAFSTDLTAAPPRELPGVVHASDATVLELPHTGRPDDGLFSPCAELVLPRDRAAALWAELDPLVRSSGLAAQLPDGASVVVIAPSALPLAVSAPDGGVVIALRPRFTDEVLARRMAMVLRALSDRAVQLGARIYPIGEEPDDTRWARQQYAPVWSHWSTLKDRLDPERHCHPWRL